MLLVHGKYVNYTGDLSFLRDCYEDYFQKVFWKRLLGFAMNDFEVISILEKMANLTGNERDVEHWQALVKQDPDHIRLMFDQRWEANGHDNFFMGAKNKEITYQCILGHAFKILSRNYAERMIHSWALNQTDGFMGKFFPLAMAKKSMKVFTSLQTILRLVTHLTRRISLWMECSSRDSQKSPPN